MINFLTLLWVFLGELLDFPLDLDLSAFIIIYFEY